MRSIALILYYNVIFSLELKDDSDVLKYKCLIARMKQENFYMRDIHAWCVIQCVKYRTKFIYRAQYPLKANIWNYIQYLMFKMQCD